MKGFVPIFGDDVDVEYRGDLNVCVKNGPGPHTQECVVVKDTSAIKMLNRAHQRFDPTVPHNHVIQVKAIPVTGETCNHYDIVALYDV